MEQERVIDGLHNSAVFRCNNGRDRVHHLSKVGHLHLVTVPDKDIEIGGDCEGVGKGVTLFQCPVVSAVPDVPFVIGDPRRAAKSLPYVVRDKQALQ